MRLSFLRVLLVAVPAVLLTTVPMHADIVFSENFNSAPLGLGVTTAGQFSTINGTNVDVIGANFGDCVGPESGNCVDMDGTGGNPIGQLELTTPLNLTAGTYFLSFDLIGSQRNTTSSVTVDFGPFSHTYTLTTGDDTDGVVSNLAVAIAGGATQLTFVSNDAAGSEEGALLDNVVISTSPVGASPVPEPESLALMTAGLLGCAGAIRRRFATKA
jgi:hypothetical protein